MRLLLLPSLLIVLAPRLLSAEQIELSFTQIREDTGCSDASCATVEISYPKVISKATPVATAMQQVLDSFVLRSPVSEGQASSPRAVADSFLNEWRDMAKSDPSFKESASSSWTHEVRVKRLFEGRDILSLAIDTRTYSGGAHGAETRQLLTFSLLTGERIKLTDVVLPEMQGAFMSLAEREFRKVRGLKPTVPLQEGGFDFEGDTFRLPDNFAILKAGLLFYYNPYEIAPYALGPTELMLPRHEVRPLIASRFLQ